MCVMGVENVIVEPCPSVAEILILSVLLLLLSYDFFELIESY